MSVTMLYKAAGLTLILLLHLAAQPSEQGRVLYNKSCTACHGLDGEAGDRAPALAGERRFRLTADNDIFDAIKSGINGTLMPPTSLKETEIRFVVAYIRSLRATALDTPVKGDVEAGRAVFFGKAECSKCHMIAGKGGLLAPDLSNVAGERKLAVIRDALTKSRPFPLRGYKPVRITTARGLVAKGVVKNENNFSVQLLDIDGRLGLFELSEVASIDPEPELAMPRDYQKRLTSAEFQNLLAFLSRQGERQPATGRRPR
ncbi:MAG: c-type cytochrome [Bryobacterales bacterium]|nr:c-type cytochrome [Bryobacterales bacterium]